MQFRLLGEDFIAQREHTKPGRSMDGMLMIQCNSNPVLKTKACLSLGIYAK